ncbi:MAG TPA: phosphatidate cytidylyltransferase [Aquifex aeolicus]|nr:phosphatidate cytidylyltransferase [Aquifex aeolicus]
MSRETYGILIGISVILVILSPFPIFFSAVMFLSYVISKEVGKSISVDISLFSPLVSLSQYFTPQLTPILIGIISLVYGYKSWSLENFFRTFFLLFYPAIFLSYLIHIREHGVYITLVFIFGLWINDIFAYYIGKHFGKTPLFPQISPKKTVEGFLGGIVLGSIFYLLFLPLSLWKSLLIAIFTLTSGVVGDYFKSFIKRLVGIKDFSNTFGEHGGFTDRFDAVVFASPVFYFLICAWKFSC